MLGVGRRGPVLPGAASTRGRRGVLAAFVSAAVAVSVLAGCGPAGALAPTAATTADPADSSDASAPEPSPADSPTTEPSPADGPTTDPSAAVEPPPVFPLPYAVDPVEQYLSDGPVEVAVSYDFAIACDGEAQLWFDDGDARDATEADGEVVDCGGSTLHLMVGVPGSVARLWASPEVYLITDRRQTGSAFSASTPLRDALAYRLSGPTTVTVGCASTNGTVVLAGVPASCAGVESVSFTGMPVAAALDELTLPPDFRGLITVSP